MSGLVLRVALLIATLAWSSVVAAADVRTLVAVGDLGTDGVPISEIAALQADRARDLAFTSATTALVTRDASGMASVFGPGRPTAPPIAAAVVAVTATAVNGRGVVAVAGTLDLPSSPSGVFLLEGGTMQQVVRRRVSRMSLGETGDLLYRIGRQWFLRSAATGGTVTVFDERAAEVPGARVARVLGVPVLTDDGSVILSVRANQAGQSGVYVWTREAGLQPVATEPGAAGRRLGTAIAARRRDRVALTRSGADPSVLVRDAASGLAVVATAGDLIEGVPIRQIDTRWVGVDADGAVVFLARSDDGLRAVRQTAGGLRFLSGPLPDPVDARMPGLTPGGRLAWTIADRLEVWENGAVVIWLHASDLGLAEGFHLTSPSVSDTGIAAAVAEHAALYRLGRDGFRPIVTSGTLLPDGRRIGDLGEAVVVVDGDATLMRLPLDGGASDTGTDAVLALARGEGALRVVAATGDPSPFGGTITGLGSALDVGLSRGGAVVFEASVTTSSEGDETTTVLRGDPRSGRVRALVRGAGPNEPVAGLGYGTLLPLGRGPTLLRGVATDEAGTSRNQLIAVHAGRAARLPVPGRGRDQALEAWAANARHLAVVVDQSGVGSGPRALWIARRRTPGAMRLVVRDGGRVPGGGRVRAFGTPFGSPGPLLLVADVEEEGRTVTRLVRLRDRGVETVVDAGATVPGASAPLSLETARIVSLPDRAVLTQQIDPADPSLGDVLVEVRKGRIARVVASGDPSPLGGVFAALSPLWARDAVVFVADITGGRASAGAFAAGLSAR